MKRIAIVGAGIAGLSAAYEIARHQKAGSPVEFTLFEATDRIGGIVETVSHNEFVIECGPDSWVSEKTAARELAIELGLESELIFSRDRHRRIYLAKDGKLQAMPHGMRMMAPVEWDDVLASPLFSPQAKRDYQREPQRAEHLKATALDGTHPTRDESVRDFVTRHFGSEVADAIAAPLLAGVFGGDIAALSARAVLPAFVALEREHGSLILALQQQRKLAAASAPPIFTSLRRGLSSLIDALALQITAANIRRRCSVEEIELRDKSWRIRDVSGNSATDHFDAILIATPAKATAKLLAPLDQRMPELFPECSSAIVVAFAFSPEQPVQIPQGFGFLVPQRDHAETRPPGGRDTPEATARRALLACTFVDQKFPHRAAPGAVLLRVFFGGPAVPMLLHQNDTTLARLAHTELERILGDLPQPVATITRRWPDSLPLYAVGHLERIAELESRASRFPNMRLIGNAYCGVGLPDLIHQGRTAAREIIADLARSEPFPCSKKT